MDHENTAPCMFKTINKSLEDIAKETPNLEMYVHRLVDGSRRSITSSKLYTKALIVARHLRNNGINKGDRIAILGPNTIEWIICEYGILLSGAIAVHLTVTMKNADDVFEMLTILKCNGIFVNIGDNQHLFDKVRVLTTANKDNLAVIKDVTVVLLDSMKRAPFSCLDDILAANGNEDVDLPEVFPEDIAAIFTTSGSTGKPKLVAHPHRSFTRDYTANNEEYVYTITHWKGGSFNERPFAWYGGNVLQSIKMPIPRIFLDSSLSQDVHNLKFIWKVIREEKCDVAFVLPYFLKDVLEMRKADLLEDYTFKCIFTGGQIIDSIYTQSVGLICQVLICGYGSTEIGGVALKVISTQGETLFPGDVGTALRGVEFRVVDDKDCPAVFGTQGSIQVKTSSTLFTEYVNDPDATREAFAPGGWFKTGDVGQLLEDGRIVVLGREKDIISRGTRKINPSKIEEIIKQMAPLIKEVAVIGVPDTRLYEEICVCFIPGEPTGASEDEVQTYCQKQFIDAHDTVDGLGLMPKYFLKFETFPQVGSGKIDKISIRKEAESRLGLNKKS